MKRRYKLLIIIIICILISFIINSASKSKKINLLVLGDSLSAGNIKDDIVGVSYSDYLYTYLANKKNVKTYSYDFSKKGLSTSLLINYLNQNIYDNKLNKPIKQIIAKADLVLISIGIDELNNQNFDSEYIDTYILNMEYIIKTIREINDKKIIITGIYNKDDINISINVNKRLQNICNKYSIYFIDIVDFPSNKDLFYDSDIYYLNDKGNYLIFNMINKIFNNA